MSRLYRYAELAQPVSLPDGPPVPCAGPDGTIVEPVGARRGPPVPCAGPVEFHPSRFHPGDLVQWECDDRTRTIEGRYVRMSSAGCAVVRVAGRLELVDVDELWLIGRGGAA
jgi:hypothetical protein